MTQTICGACWHQDRADRIRATRQGDPYYAPALEGALRAAYEEPHVPSAPNCRPDDWEGPQAPEYSEYDAEAYDEMVRDDMAGRF